MAQHIISQGECLSNIAKQYGLFRETIWNHPNNNDLREKRKTQNILLPGDELFIPEKDGKELARNTEKKHVFKVKLQLVKLNLRMLRDDIPRKNAAYILTVDGKTIRGKTDSDGWLRHQITAKADTCKLVLMPGTETEEEYELLLGHLDPHDEETGLSGRLQNLGFYVQPPDEENDLLETALDKFAEKNNLGENGSRQAKIEKLKEVHGC